MTSEIGKTLRSFPKSTAEFFPKRNRSTLQDGEWTRAGEGTAKIVLVNSLFIR
jgi:hypothetical protein